MIEYPSQWSHRGALLLAVSVALTLSGCVASGTKYDDRKVADIKVGVTTEADLIEMLGEPTSRTASANGATQLYWSYYSLRSRPETYIPVIGMFIGGTDYETKGLSVSLDADGKVSDYSSTSSGAAQDMGP